MGGPLAHPEALDRAMSGRKLSDRDRRLMLRLRQWYQWVSLPFAILFLLYNPHIHAEYRMGWRRRIKLALQMFRNTRAIPTATSYKAHLVMAVKLLELPPKAKGVVVECGCWEGGSTANLSLVCDIVGRDLIVYDSFEGLPAPEQGDRYARPEFEGMLRAPIETVREHVRRYGAIDRCEFRKGWFHDTLPHHTEPVALCFLDVDYEASLYDCVVNLWPHLTDRGYVFIDEYSRIDYCALFFSERFWRDEFDRSPPGLLGTGTGVGVGQFFVGPLREIRGRLPLQAPTSVAYTRKDFQGEWTYVRDEEAAPAATSTDARLSRARRSTPTRPGPARRPSPSSATRRRRTRR